MYLWRDFVLFTLFFGLVRMRTLHCAYETCSVFVEGFRFVYLPFVVVRIRTLHHICVSCVVFLKRFRFVYLAFRCT